MSSVVQMMKSIVVFYSNYAINHNANTDARLARVQCERNICEQELQRLRYGLECLLNHRDQIRNKSWVDQWWPCCRRWNENRSENVAHPSISPFRSAPVRDSSVSTSYSSRPERDLLPPGTTTDRTYQSLFFKNLETKILDCLCTSQKIDNNALDSVSITSPSRNMESSSISSVPSNTDSFSPASQLSSTESISSLQSSSISAFPTSNSIAQIDRPEPKLTSQKDLLDINDYKKSQLAVPVAKLSRPKKSKKRKKPSAKHKKPHKSTNIKRRSSKGQVPDIKRRSSKSRSAKSK